MKSFLRHAETWDGNQDDVANILSVNLSVNYIGIRSSTSSWINGADFSAHHFLREREKKK